MGFLAQIWWRTSTITNIGWKVRHLETFAMYTRIIKRLYVMSISLIEMAAFLFCAVNVSVCVNFVDPWWMLLVHQLNPVRIRCMQLWLVVFCLSRLCKQDVFVRCECRHIMHLGYLSYLFIAAWLSVWSEVQTICIWSSWCHCHPSYLASLNSRSV